MFVHDINPVLLDLGPLQIRYYGLAYVLAFLLGYWFLNRAAESGEVSNLTRRAVDDFMLWLMVGVVAGGRIGYFLFYNWAAFLTNPLELFMIWHGGMAFHGGLIGAWVAAYWFTKKRRIRFYDIADLLAIPAAIGLGIGRIANFINGEIVGTKTNVPWCFKFEGFDGCRHPVQLYLALKNFAVAGVIYYLQREVRERGFLFWNFVLFYAIGRFVFDFMRAEPTLFILSTGQYLNLAMIAVSGYYVWTKFYNKNKD